MCNTKTQNNILWLPEKSENKKIDHDDSETNVSNKPKYLNKLNIYKGIKLKPN